MGMTPCCMLKYCVMAQAVFFNQGDLYWWKIKNLLFYLAKIYGSPVQFILMLKQQIAFNSVQIQVSFSYNNSCFLYHHMRDNSPLPQANSGLFT